MWSPGDVACPIHLQNKATKPKTEDQTKNKNKEEKGKDILTRRRLKHFQHQEKYNCDSRIYWKAKVDTGNQPREWNGISMRNLTFILMQAVSIVTK